MQVSELKESIKGLIEPCYILSGNLSYLQSKAMTVFDNMIDGFARDFNYSRYSGGSNLNEVIGALNTPPIMSEFRLVIWENGVGNSANSQLPATLEAFKNYLKSPSNTSILVIVDKEEKCRSIYRSACIVNCSKIDKPEMFKEADEIIAAQSLTADYSIVKELVERCNSDLSILGGEVAKLKQISRGGIITMSDLDFCIQRSVPSKIYELSDAVIKRNVDKAYSITLDLLNRGFEPTVLLYKLIEYYRSAFYAKIAKESDEEVLSKLKIHVYAFKLMKETIKLYSPMELKSILEKLQSLEHALKSTSINPRDSILNMVCKLSNKTT